MLSVTFPASSTFVTVTVTICVPAFAFTVTTYVFESSSAPPAGLSKSGDFLNARTPPVMVKRALSTPFRDHSMASPSWSVAVKVATGPVPFSA